jgi:hypothetical protein
MGGWWTAGRRSQTRVEEDHTDRHHEKVGYLATYSRVPNRRSRHLARRKPDLKVGLAETKSEASKQGTLASHVVLVNLPTALAAEYEDSFSFELIVDPLRRLSCDCAVREAAHEAITTKLSPYRNDPHEKIWPNGSSSKFQFLRGWPKTYRHRTAQGIESIGRNSRNRVTDS